ncbi:UNVERIFIED_CONTAM: hypothetical protein K2H54_051628 [Gekko kuhli]
MEAKALFNMQKALVQPFQMCMLDIPLSVQDEEEEPPCRALQEEETSPGDGVTQMPRPCSVPGIRGLKNPSSLPRGRAGVALHALELLGARDQALA